MILPEQRVKVRAGAFQRRLFCYNVLRLQLARIGGFPLEAAERVCVVQVDVFVALCVGVNIVGAVGVWSGDKRRVALVEGFSYSTLSALCPGSVICFAAASLPPSTYMPKPPCSISAELTSCARADTPEMTTSAPKMTAVHNSFSCFSLLSPPLGQLLVGVANRVFVAGARPIIGVFHTGAYAYAVVRARDEALYPGAS